MQQLQGILGGTAADGRIDDLAIEELRKWVADLPSGIIGGCRELRVRSTHHVASLAIARLRFDILFNAPARSGDTSGVETMSRPQFCGLESRVLLSHGSSSAPTGMNTSKTPDPAKLEADRAAVVASLATLSSHLEANKAALAAAKAELTSDHNDHVDTVKPLKAEYKRQEKALKAEEQQLKDGRKAVDAKWSEVLATDKADVAVVESTETPEEVAADQARLASDTAAYKAERSAIDASYRSDRKRIEARIKANREAFHDAEAAAKKEIKASENRVKTAERTLKDVFQADRKIVEDAIKSFKKDGGDSKTLDLPNLSKLLKV